MRLSCVFVYSRSPRRLHRSRSHRWLLLRTRICSLFHSMSVRLAFRLVFQWALKLRVNVSDRLYVHWYEADWVFDARDFRILSWSMSFLSASHTSVGNFGVPSLSLDICELCCLFRIHPKQIPKSIMACVFSVLPFASLLHSQSFSHSSQMYVFLMFRSAFRRMWCDHRTLPRLFVELLVSYIPRMPSMFCFEKKVSFTIIVLVPRVFRTVTTLSSFSSACFLDVLRGVFDDAVWASNFTAINCLIFLWTVTWYILSWFVCVKVILQKAHQTCSALLEWAVVVVGSLLRKLSI